MRTSILNALKVIGLLLIGASIFPAYYLAENSLPEETLRIVILLLKVIAVVSGVVGVIWLIASAFPDSRGNQVTSYPRVDDLYEYGEPVLFAGPSGPEFKVKRTIKGTGHFDWI
jgi:hypothetical protein